MVDIDDFKRINDTCGHIAGDRILVELTRLIQRNIRKVDILGRWGGEEFLIILPDCNIKSGRSVAEKIRKTIETHQFDIEESLTCSFGVSEFEADRKIEKIVARADAALYIAKSHGKNRVESLEKS
jgi:diguanylate cyclase (GGDEF)-like protein